VARAFAWPVRRFGATESAMRSGGTAAVGRAGADQYLSGFFDLHGATAGIDDDFRRGLADPNVSASCSAA